MRSKPLATACAACHAIPKLQVSASPKQRGREGDALDAASLAPSMVGVHAAYYLVHSMASANSFEEEDRSAAHVFATAARDAGVQRIVYLCGLGSGSELSAHLFAMALISHADKAIHLPVRLLPGAIIFDLGWAQNGAQSK